MAHKTLLFLKLSLEVVRTVLLRGRILSSGRPKMKWSVHTLVSRRWPPPCFEGGLLVRNYAAHILGGS
jgi:hypothetical protein